MSSFAIDCIARIIAPTFAGSPEAPSRLNSRGTTCQETPQRSVHQPH